MSREIDLKDLSREIGSEDFVQLSREIDLKDFDLTVKGNWFRRLCPVVKESWFCYYVGLFPEGTFMLRIYDA